MFSNVLPWSFLICKLFKNIQMRVFISKFYQVPSLYVSRNVRFCSWRNETQDCANFTIFFDHSGCNKKTD